MAVGYHVFHQRNQLRNLTLSNQAKDASGTDLRGSAEKVPLFFPLSFFLFLRSRLAGRDVCHTLLRHFHMFSPFSFSFLCFVLAPWVFDMLT